MCDFVPPVTVTSVALVTQSSNDIEEWVNSFFTLTFKENDQSEITDYCNQHFNSIALDYHQILEQCKETFSHALNNHFEKNAIGGSIPFLQGPLLQDAIQDALNKSMEECEVLLKISSSIHPKEHCRDRIKAKLEVICGAFKKQNEDRRFHFITRNAKKIVTGFVEKLKKSYYLLHCEKETEQLNHDNTQNGRPIPHEKFYDHQQMTKFVSDITKHTIAKCDAFINKMKVSPSESSSRPPTDGAFKMLEDAKGSIKKFGEDLRTKNTRHQKMTADYIDQLISTEFEKMCRSEVIKMSFPETDDIKAVVLKVKENIRIDIRKVLQKNSVDTKYSLILESEYHTKFETIETTAFKACLKEAVIEAEKSINGFIDKLGEQLKPEKSIVWISKLAKESKVPDSYVTTVSNHLLIALNQIKEDCLGTLILSEGNSVHSQQATECLEDPKSSEILVQRNDDTRDNLPLDMEQVSPQQINASSSRKHRYPHSDRSHNRAHSVGKRRSEKRGKY